MALTKLNNKAVANVTSIPVALGDMVLVSSATASSSASIEFSLGDYKEYKFFFVNMHPDASDAQFGFQVSKNGGTSYGVAITSSAIEVYHGGLQYGGNNDLAQSTNLQFLTNTVYHLRSEESANGHLTLFNPSSTTFVKHWISECSRLNNTTFVDHLHAGYINSTSAVNAIQFKFSAGNIDAGKILMFGIN